MTQDAKSQRLRYRAHSGLTTDKLVFTGYDFYALGGKVRTVTIDCTDLDTAEAYGMAKALSDWCERVLRECAAEWAAEAQLDLFEGA